VYAATGERHQLVWVDRGGTSTPMSADRAAFRIPRLSPDGRHVAVSVNDEISRRPDIWIYDAERGTKSRLTSEGGLRSAWTPDGARVAFSQNDHIVEVAKEGGPSNILLTAGFRRPESWSPDGRYLLLHADEPTGFDLWVLERDTRTVRPLLVRPFNDRRAQFSRNGRWVAYMSDESGREEIYVDRFPDLGRKTAISTDGGREPVWSRDELFNRQGDAVMAVTVETTVDFHAGKPRRLFVGNYTGSGGDPGFDVTPDGQRFVMIKSDDAATLRELTLVQNWTEELNRLVPKR
jgi:Tol biopolymer transport system component